MGRVGLLVIVYRKLRMEQRLSPRIGWTTEEKTLAEAGWSEDEIAASRRTLLANIKIDVVRHSCLTYELHIRMFLIRPKV
jgi:hypothetical protein